MQFRTACGQGALRFELILGNLLGPDRLDGFLSFHALPEFREPTVFRPEVPASSCSIRASGVAAGPLFTAQHRWHPGWAARLWPGSAQWAGQQVLLTTRPSDRCPLWLLILRLRCAWLGGSSAFLALKGDRSSGSAAGLWLVLPAGGHVWKVACSQHQKRSRSKDAVIMAQRNQ